MPVHDDGCLPFDAVRVGSFAEECRRSSLPAFQRLAADRKALERSLIRPGSFLLPGTCAVCRRPTEFLTDWQHSYPAADGVRIPNWRERQACLHCHFNSRMRAAVHFFEATVKPRPGAAIYATEQASPLFALLHRRYPDIIGSECLGERVPLGATDERGLRNEDLTRLSFADQSFAAILSFDVLEHVPDWRQALAECHRCLKPGGALLLSAPFNRGSAGNIIHARLEADGGVEHLDPPQYHGDPLDPDNGVLCFQTFGWELLDALRAVGFADAAVHFFWSRELGYLGSEQNLILASRGQARSAPGEGMDEPLGSSV